MNVFFKLKLNLLLFIKLDFFFRIIDNLISDQMKHIWINLELYFESNDFSDF